VDGQSCFGGKLGIAEVDFDSAEPGQHRATFEGFGATLEFDTVEDSDERELVTVLVAARRHSPLDERRCARHPSPRAELEDQQCAKQAHLARA
jgi:hypothetical protein